jgi:hypothetical protein
MKRKRTINLVVIVHFTLRAKPKIFMMPIYIYDNLCNLNILYLFFIHRRAHKNIITSDHRKFKENIQNASL